MRGIRAILLPVCLLFLCCGCVWTAQSDTHEAPSSPVEPPEGPSDQAAASPDAPLETSSSSNGAPGANFEPADSDFVKVTDYIPTILVDLAYAGADNFTGQAIYDFTDAYLRYGTVKKLSAAQAQLAEQGMGLLIWDAFRPTAAQFDLWEICPDPAYVADPTRGFSSHSRGNTVDVTLVALDGTAIEMPTGFDDFSPLADRDYSDVSAGPAANAKLLEETMVQSGFTPYQGEWWHFSDSDSYAVETEFSP